VGGVSGLDQRLRVLEAGDGGRCPACGLGPGSRVHYTVSWGDEPGEDAPAVSSPACLMCGQRRRIVLDWDDAGAPDELAPDYPLWSDEGGGLS